MNNIKLHGTLTNIQTSHTIDDIQYDKATLLVPRYKQNKEDVINIRFKHFSLPLEYQQYPTDCCQIDLVGQVRSYSQKKQDGSNKVELYVFTYFDLPERTDEDIDYTVTNQLLLDGRICKIDDLRETSTGKHNIHLILANNIIVSNGLKKLNSYIPCIAWGTVAKRLSKLSVNTPISIDGELHSREYIKHFSDGSSEIRVAHECLIRDFTILETI